MINCSTSLKRHLNIAGTALFVLAFGKMVFAAGPTYSPGTGASGSAPFTVTVTAGNGESTVDVLCPGSNVDSTTCGIGTDFGSRRSFSSPHPVIINGAGTGTEIHAWNHTSLEDTQAFYNVSGSGGGGGSGIVVTNGGGNGVWNPPDTNHVINSNSATLTVVVQDQSNPTSGVGIFVNMINVATGVGTSCPSGAGGSNGTATTQCVVSQPGVYTPHVTATHSGTPQLDKDLPTTTIGVPTLSFSPVAPGGWVKPSALPAAFTYKWSPKNAHPTYAWSAGSAGCSRNGGGTLADDTGLPISQSDSANAYQTLDVSNVTGICTFSVSNPGAPALSPQLMLQVDGDLPTIVNVSHGSGTGSCTGTAPNLTCKVGDTLNITASDGTSGVNTNGVSLSWNGGAPIAASGAGCLGQAGGAGQPIGCTTPSAFVATTPVLPAGSYSVNVTAVDYAGNVSSPQTLNITISDQLSLTSIDPNTISTAGNGGLPIGMQVHGTGFTSSTQVQICTSAGSGCSTAAIQLTSIQPTLIVAQISTANQILQNPPAQNIYYFEVTDGAAVSSPVTFTIPSSAITITDIQPQPRSPGSTPFILTVTGTGFANGSAPYIDWNVGGAISGVPSTHISATVNGDGTSATSNSTIPTNTSGGYLGNPSVATSIPVRFCNSTSQCTPTANFQVTPLLRPSINTGGLNPPSADQGTGPLQMVIAGQNFNANCNATSCSNSVIFGGRTIVGYLPDTSADPRNWLYVDINTSDMHAQPDGTCAGSAVPVSVKDTATGAVSDEVCFGITSAAGPTISQLNPTTMTQGTDTPFTITGSGFSNPSVEWCTNYVSATNNDCSPIGITVTPGAGGTLTGTISGTFLTGKTAGGPNLLAVLNVGSPSILSNAITITLQPAGAGTSPHISILNPTSMTQGTDTPFTITGSGFASASVEWCTNYVSATNNDCSPIGVAATPGGSGTSQTLIGTIPGTFLSGKSTSGFNYIAVGNAGPPVVVSNAIQVTLNSAGGGTGPHISNLNPTIMTQGTDTPFTITGSGFSSPSVEWCTQVSGTSSDCSPIGVTVTPGGSGTSQTLTGTISGTFLSGKVVGGPNLMAVLNVGTPSVLSNAIAITLNSTSVGVAHIVNINPTGGTVNTPTAITINGTGFTNSATVTLGGQTATATGNSTQLTATIPAFSSAQSLTLTVTNQGSSTPSNGVTFTIAAGPHISGLNPSTVQVGATGITLVVSGSGFTSNSIIQSNSSGIGTTIFGSANQVSVSLPPSMLSSANSYPITVADGGNTSNIFQFTVQAPGTPVISISPTSAQQGSSGVPLTVTAINGTSFHNGDVISLGGIGLTTTFAGSTQLNAFIPASMLTTAGSPNVQVVASAGLSNQVPFTINSLPAPTITGMSTTHGAVNTQINNLTLTGSGFANGTKVAWGGPGGTQLNINFTNANTIVLPVVDASLVVAGGNFLSACNGTNCDTIQTTGNTYTGDTSSGGTGPTITNLNPTIMTQGTDTPITITGSGFSSASVEWCTNYVSASSNDCAPIGISVTAGGSGTNQTLTGTIPGSFLTGKTPGSPNYIAVVVAGPPSQTSNAISITLNNPSGGSGSATLTSATPHSLPAGSPAQTVTIVGTNLTNDFTVDMDGTPLTTTFINAQTLNINVLASLLASPKIAHLEACPSVGACTNTINFSITAGSDTTTTTTTTTTSSAPPTTATTTTTTTTMPLPGQTTTIHWDSTPANNTSSSFALKVHSAGGVQPTTLVHVLFTYWDDLTGTTKSDYCLTTVTPDTNHDLIFPCSPQNKTNSGNTKYLITQAQAGAGDGACTNKTGDCSSSTSGTGSWSALSAPLSPSVQAWTTPEPPNDDFDPVVGITPAGNSIQATIEFNSLNSTSTLYALEADQNPTFATGDTITPSIFIQNTHVPQLTISGLLPLTPYYVRTHVKSNFNSTFDVYTPGSQGPSTAAPPTPGSIVSTSTNTITAKWTIDATLLARLNFSTLLAGATDATGNTFPISLTADPIKTYTDNIPSVGTPVITLHNLQYANAAYTLYLQGIAGTAAPLPFPASSILGYTAAVIPLKPQVALSGSGSAGINLIVTPPADTSNSPDSLYAFQVTEGASIKYLDGTGALSATAVLKKLSDWGTSIPLNTLDLRSTYSIKAGVMQIDPANAVLIYSEASSITSPGDVPTVTITPPNWDNYFFGVGLDASNPFTAVTFGTDMDTTQLPSKVVLTNLDTNAVVTNPTLVFPDRHTLQIQGLAPATRYQLTVQPGIQDAFGLKMTQGTVTESFMTAIDPSKAATLYSPYDTMRSNTVTVPAGALGSGSGWYIVPRTQLISPSSFVSASPAAVQSAESANQNLIIVNQMEVLIYSNPTGSNPIAQSSISSPITLTMSNHGAGAAGAHGVGLSGAVGGAGALVDQGSLQIYYLKNTNGQYHLAKVDNQHLTSGSVTAPIQNSGVYILAGYVSTDLSSAYAYPVPFKPSAGHTSIKFANLAADSTIKVYTILGELVAQLHNDNGDSTLQWNVTNTEGQPVASGVYIFQIKNSFSETRGKVIVIR